MDENDVQTLQLSRRELNLIVIGMTSAQYPLTLQAEAFNLVMKLRDVIRDSHKT